MRLMEVQRDVNPDRDSWWCTGYGCSCSDKIKYFWCICFLSENGITVQFILYLCFLTNRPLVKYTEVSFLFGVCFWFVCGFLFGGLVCWFFFLHSVYLGLVRGSSNRWWLRMINGLNISGQCLGCCAVYFLQSFGRKKELISQDCPPVQHIFMC